MTRWARTRWARTRWARTRWARTRWPATKCRIEDGDIGDTRSPWPGKKWTRCRTTRSSKYSRSEGFDFVAPKKGFGAPKECAGSTCISQVRTTHTPLLLAIKETRLYTTQESETGQDRRIMPD